MNERDELAKHYTLIHHPRQVFCQCGAKLWDAKETGGVVMLPGLNVAESLHVAHQAEMVKPRTITTVEELGTVYGGAILRDADGTVWAVDGGSDRLYLIEEGRDETYSDDELTLPATVLWEPR